MLGVGPDDVAGDVLAWIFTGEAEDALAGPAAGGGIEELDEVGVGIWRKPGVTEAGMMGY